MTYLYWARPYAIWPSRILLIAYIGLLSACAAPLAISSSERPYHTGRLGIKTLSNPLQQTSLGFTLIGNAETGQLHLTTPLGTKAAELIWGSGFASFSDGKIERNFPDLASALKQATGVIIPVFMLFNWLQGKQEKALEASMGWEADLSNFVDGRITVIRLQPLPQIELRLVLELSTP